MEEFLVSEILRLNKLRIRLLKARKISRTKFLTENLTRNCKNFCEKGHWFGFLIPSRVGVWVRLDVHVSNHLSDVLCPLLALLLLFQPAPLVALNFFWEFFLLFWKDVTVFVFFKAKRIDKCSLYQLCIARSQNIIVHVRRFCEDCSFVNRLQFPRNLYTWQHLFSMIWVLTFSHVQVHCSVVFNLSPIRFAESASTAFCIWTASSWSLHLSAFLCWTECSADLCVTPYSVISYGKKGKQINI